jgi:type IV pilus assembly protein PilY1
MPQRIALLAFFLLLPAKVALAQTPAAGACCSSTTSRMDELVNPVTGSDEKFFSQPSGPPNVSFVIDNSCSMRFEFPVRFCTDNSFRNGCSCPEIDALGYSNATTYEAEIDNLNSGSFYTSWFRNDRVYDIRNYSSSAPSYGDNGPGTAPVANTWSISGSFAQASSYSTASGGPCNGVATGARSTCQQCLATKGYFIGESHRTSGDLNNRTDWRLTGNFLNHYSPRYLMARKVVKQVIRDIQPVRMMSLMFNNTDGTVGPRVLTEWNPPCNLSDPYKNANQFFSNRQAVINSLDNNLRFNGNTPLAKSLYSAGYAFQLATTDPAQHVYIQSFGSTWQSAMALTNAQITDLTEKSGNNQKAVCFSCTFNAIILLTDGEPNNPNENTVPGTVGSNQFNWPDCPNCLNTNLDEVAAFLWNADLRPDHPGQQKVATYTIGFGLEATSWARTLLRYTAQEGGGKFFPAHSATQLRRSILDIFDDINSRNIAFSAANVASLQVTGGAQAAVIPRMSPRKDQSWLGYLWRFGLYNEFIENNDFNSNGNKDDVFIIDADGDIVVEDLAGRFVKQGTATSAVPFWEAGAKLREPQGVMKGWEARKVWTVRDTAAPAGAFTAADGVTEFSSAPDKWGQLKPYLAVAGTAACPTVNSDFTVVNGGILDALGLTFQQVAELYNYSSLPLELDALKLLADELCHRALIDWTRGRDLGDEDGDGNRSETRLSVLGDIFHSSPVTVDPPVDRFLCDIGLHNQCVRTLYAPSGRLGVAATPLEEETTSFNLSPCSPARDVDAYDKYHHDNRAREKVILVGANDGMLHAFRDNRGSTSCDGAVEIIDYAVKPATSGFEAWALIPPDALPRLHLQLLEGHKYFVDGDLMVRDIWNDDDGNLKKKSNEFKTIAIAAMGRGGNHYFAVEVLWENDANGIRVVRDRPQFLWMFPQPCSDESALFGKTLYALSPKPPPLGPVLLQKSATPPTDPSQTATQGTARYGVGTEERWVTILSGGWSPGQEKGRGIYMVDAYRGVASTSRNDNLLWKYDYDPNASTTDQRNAPRRHMTHSIVAPVSMVDYGANDNVRLDGFFDTAVVGDLAGQVWVFRFHKPGVVDSTTGLVSNWGGARTFQQNIQGSPAIRRTWPFYLPASIGLQPDNNALRAFIGTGNRYDLLGARAGECRFDSPQVCAKYGCDVNIDSYVRKNTINVSSASNRWNGSTSPTQSHVSGGQTTSSAAVSACGVATAGITTHTIGCGIGSVRQPQVECRLNAAGVYVCARTDTTTMNLGTVVDNGSNTMVSALTYNRFYGFWAYGRNVNRMFDEDRTTVATPTTPPTPQGQTALQFDNARLTDRRASDVGDLVNVTTTECTSTGCTGPQATSSGMGWFFEYRNSYGGGFNHDLSLSHKTASGASLIASCVLWNTLYPVTQTGVCSTPSAAKARFHQADFITGAPNCAFSFNFQRFQERDVLAPPPEPATAVQISKNGQIRLSTLIVEPGQAQATTVSVTTNSDVLQSVYELPISKELHDCRHTPAGCRPTVP